MDDPEMGSDSWNSFNAFNVALASTSASSVTNFDINTNTLIAATGNNDDATNSDLPVNRRSLEWFKKRSGSSNDYAIIRRSIRLARIEDVFDMFRPLDQEIVNDLLTEALHNHQSMYQTSTGFCRLPPIPHTVLH
jgi:hypothetical protein